MTKGCVIYAFKKPAYGKMAWNLCMSIKAVSPDMPVAVIHDGHALDHLEQWRQDFFDHRILMSEDDLYVFGKFSPGKGKLSGYKYLPFDENIIIDADSICVSDVNNLFTRCTKNIHSQCVGSWDQSAESWSCQWMGLPDVKKLYELPDVHTIYEINSSFFFVRKSKEAEALYDKALHNLKIGWGHPMLQTWGGGFPDELGWNVAFAQLGIHPQFADQKVLSNDAQEPIFFSTRFTNDWNHVYSKYYFIGYFGDKYFTDKSLQDMYDRIMIGVGRKFGFDHHYKMHQLMNQKHVKEK
jgi:hypothetical protein